MINWSAFLLTLLYILLEYFIPILGFIIVTTTIITIIYVRYGKDTNTEESDEIGGKSEY